jgi:hypothetical protein
MFPGATVGLALRANPLAPAAHDYDLTMKFRRLSRLKASANHFSRRRNGDVLGRCFGGVRVVQDSDAQSKALPIHYDAGTTWCGDVTQTLGRPRLEGMRAVDILSLTGSGFCFGIAFAFLMMTLIGRSRIGPGEGAK